MLFMAGLYDVYAGGYAVCLFLRVTTPTLTLHTITSLLATHALVPDLSTGLLVT